MRHRVWMLVAIVAATLVPVQEAGAVFTCALPDNGPPILHEFAMRPAGLRPPVSLFDVFEIVDPSAVGTRMEILADDRIHHLSEYEQGYQPNPIVRVTAELYNIDSPPAPIPDPVLAELEAEDGRYGGYLERAFYVFGPDELFPGVYDVEIRAQDACGSVGVRHERVYHAPPVTGTCTPDTEEICER